MELAKDVQNLENYVKSLEKGVEHILNRDLASLKKKGFRLSKIIQGDSPEANYLHMEIETKVPQAKNFKEYHKRGIQYDIKYVTVAHVYPLTNKVELVPRDFVDIKPVKSLLKNLGYKISSPA